MKISVDDQEVFTLSDMQKQVIMNDIHEDIFDEDMKRRLQYILMHKYDRCYQRLMAEWMPKLKDRVNSIPTDPEECAKLIFSQPDYKNRSAKEKDNEA